MTNLRFFNCIWLSSCSSAALGFWRSCWMQVHFGTALCDRALGPLGICHPHLCELPWVSIWQLRGVWMRLVANNRMTDFVCGLQRWPPLQCVDAEKLFPCFPARQWSCFVGMTERETVESICKELISWTLAEMECLSYLLFHFWWCNSFIWLEKLLKSASWKLYV